jgi:hypothetical protein
LLIKNNIRISYCHRNDQIHKWKLTSPHSLPFVPGEIIGNASFSILQMVQLQ